MAEQQEVNMYDYTIVHKLPKNEQRRFVGEISHTLADGALILLKKVLDQESWLVVEEEDKVLNLEPWLDIEEEDTEGEQ
jgi:hypothetical protein